MNVDVLIIGQGLAGSLLAWELLDRDVSFCIVDGALPHAAHAASAGMMNPVAGPKRNRPWAWDVHFPVAASRYRDLSDRLGRKLFHELRLLACFRDAADRDRSLGRIDEGLHQGFVGEVHDPGTFAPQIADEFGSYEMIAGRRFDVREFVALSRREFRASGCFREETFRPEDMRQNDDGRLTWNDLQSRHLVLATGHRAATTPWFDDLPWRISRGETLDLDARGFTPPRDAVNRKEWLLNLGSHRLRVGALYDWHAPEAGPTPEGREHLLAAAQRLGAPDRSVIDHRAGTRAGGIDWKPYLGRGRGNERVFLFGGLGSKGALHAPALAGLVADHLLKGESIPPELDLDRRR